ncbi:DUF6328 family protein [Nocardioides daejeonensis]|uniref:DUF6328 family protein n=1 Tax=Nocardioides daejeonensis TaxID=1046556 RepID=UPI000D742E31|nr:DUF6328 family protein [Nocardioides daejeonensis]
MPPRPLDESDDGRNESPAARSDRNWNELLQEFRVLQTGVQILGGFLLTLPFQSRFGDLDPYQETWYLGLVLLAAVTTVALLAPIAVHREMFRRRRKQETVVVGHLLARTVTALVGLLIAGVAAFVFDVVLGRTAGWVAGGAVLLVAAAALGALPRWVAAR